MKKHNKHILFLIFFCTITLLKAQVADNPFSVEFSGTQISLQQPFTVSIKVTGLDQVPSIIFPDNIKNFQKRESSRSSLTSKTGRTTVVTYTISQNYYPIKVGTYNTGPLEILVNKQVLRSEGTVIMVEKGISNSNEEVDVLSDFTSELEDETTEGAFLAVSVNKRRVYVQQGFNLRLSLLVSENNTTEMDFYEVEKQLEKILKILKPANCWEESFGIQEIPAIPITIGGKNFTEYRIYQASFFPLNNQSIQIPTVKLTMKILSKTEGEPENTTLQTFSSKPLAISVIDLPLHPLRNQVIVGNFRLEEKISNNVLETGQSYRYDFRILGEGNIQSVQEPTFSNKALFDVYPPDIENNVLRQKGQITGAKTFRYQIIPKQNGNFVLGNIIFWVYFNSQKQMYDTLRSTLKLTIKGDNIQSAQLASSESESVYTGIEQWDTTKSVIDYQTIIRNIANVLVIIMLIGMIFIFKK